MHPCGRQTDSDMALDREELETGPEIFRDEAGEPRTDFVASVETAVARILGREHKPSRILICGSLYLAGVVLEKNG